LTPSSPASAMRSGIPRARATPPANEIENPNPQSGTNNYYTQGGCSGGSFSVCADTSQPGVSDVVSYLQSLPHKIAPHCNPTHCWD
jgi:phospholipase C